MLKVHAESTQRLKKCFGQETNKEEQLIKAVKKWGSISDCR
ncbi:hypothetical protein CISIN_1g043359mg [Citrus sinensis]|uniref:Uncharacterized protein n=1 Tax=Citrus sinensis TaxID=2711 RepID=A0A067F0U2_CITSI|nr:hypothetical protein CISIN_1g043359mg [Citrus sinensis]